MPRITLAEEIGKRILRDFSAGKALPSERELSERYQCNRLTLRRALKELNKAGLLTSVSRGGHFIVDGALENIAKNDPLMEKKAAAHILVLCNQSSSKDITRNYVISGLIHHASRYNINITFKEMSDDMNHEPHLSMHPGLDIDGYIICGGVSFKLYELLAKSMRPCVMIGLFKDQHLEQNYELRCLQFLMTLEEPYADLTKRLIAAGHRKIMLASLFCDKEILRIKDIMQRQFLMAGIADSSIDEQSMQCREPHVSNSFAITSAREIARRVSDHTAIVITGGNVFGYQMVKSLLNERNFKCPDDLSIAVQCSEADWFNDIYNLDKIYFERFELGGACIREIMRQIDNGRLEYGIRYLPGSYIPGESIGTAKN